MSLVSSWVSCSILIISHAQSLLVLQACTQLSYVMMGMWEPPPCPHTGMLGVLGCWVHWDAGCTSNPQARCRAPSPASLLFSSSSNMHRPLLAKKDFLPFFKGKAEIFIFPGRTELMGQGQTPAKAPTKKNGLKPEKIRSVSLMPAPRATAWQTLSHCFSATTALELLLRFLAPQCSLSPHHSQESTSRFSYGEDKFGADLQEEPVPWDTL